MMIVLIWDFLSEITKYVIPDSLQNKPCKLVTLCYS